MIIAEQKTLNDLIRMLEGHRKVLVVGCRSCVAVCLAGGEKEVGILAESLRLHSDLAGKGWQVEEATLERACEKEWVRRDGGFHGGPGRHRVVGLRGGGPGHP